MAPISVSIRGRGLFGAAAFALSFLCAAALHAESPKPEETLPLGEIRERSIAAGETHAWRMTVEPGRALAVTVEMKSMDLDLEARRIGSGVAIGVKAVSDRWGPEVLLLETAGDYRLEIRPLQARIWTGRYILRTEAFPAQPAESARRDALALMSRAGQEAVPETDEARKRSLASYRGALAAWRSLGEGERTWEAETLVCIAILEQDLSDFRAATQTFEAALRLWQELKVQDREAEVWGWLGGVYLRTKGTKEARNAWEKSLFLWQRLGLQFDEAETRQNLCSLERETGSLPVALDCFRQNLTFFHENGDAGNEAEVHNSLGRVYDFQGEPEDALASYERARALWHTLSDSRREARALNNLAVVHRTLGDWQEALHLYGQASEVLGPLTDRTLTAVLLNNIGNVYNSLGEPRRALSYLQEALKVRREVDDPAGEISTLNNIGTAWRQLGVPAKALGWHQQALDLAASRNDVAQQAISHLRLGEVHLDHGEAVAALRDLDAALALVGEKGDRRTALEILHQKGRALTLAGRAQEALPVLQKALAGRRDVKDRAGEAETLYELARTERILGLNSEAISKAREAVTLVEGLRIGVLNADLRASFLATRHRAFSLLIDLLMDRHAADPEKGYDREAFAISERARARSLLDVLLSGRVASTATPQLLTERTFLLRKLSAKIDQHWKQSGNRAEALQEEIKSLHAEVERTEAEIRRQDRRFAEFSLLKPVDFQEIDGWLEPGTMLLEYSLGEERSFLWVLETGRLHAVPLPSQETIETLARQAYDEISMSASGPARRGKAADKLAQILLGPVWNGSEAARLQRLIVVPDGALGVLPFAALPVPEPGKGWEIPRALQPLLTQVEVVYISSATTLAAQRQGWEHRARASKWAAVLADPVFAVASPHVAQRSAALPATLGKRAALKSGRRGPGTAATLEALEPLPATRNEADAIKGLAPPGQVWLGLGLDASRDAVLSGKLRDFNIVHFATHAVADTSNPELSGLFLSQVDAAGRPQNGFLGLSDIYELDLDAGLVVLSGCRTALGKEVRGEGLMGLTRGFQYAGVPRVVASLWPVQDRATAKLMSRFYKAMWRDRKPLAPAAALREAQRWLSSDLKYKNPYFWAGFVLLGDWR